MALPATSEFDEKVDLAATMSGDRQRGPAEVVVTPAKRLQEELPAADGGSMDVRPYLPLAVSGLVLTIGVGVPVVIALRAGDLGSQAESAASNLLPAMLVVVALAVAPSCWQRLRTGSRT